ncbi:MAG: metal ABC transporter permease [Bacteroidota bacterium]
MNALIIIITGALVASSCSILGSFLILRKMAMVSDAISHAVLPGIVIAFLLGSDIDSLWMLAGAGAVGLLTTFLIEFFHQKGRLQTDASIGVTFTWLFALGVILLSYYAGDAHIDEACVLYGEIAYVPLDLIELDSGAILGPKALIVLLFILMVNLVFVTLGYKELKITTFDPSFARSVGISPSAWHYALMSLVSLTTVGSFESVGAILVVALIVTPPATAYLMTQDLTRMLVLAVSFGISSSILGYFLAYVLDGSISGAMATVAGLQFAVVFIAVKQRNRAIIRQGTAPPLEATKVLH